MLHFVTGGCKYSQIISTNSSGIFVSSIRYLYAHISNYILEKKKIRSRSKLHCSIGHRRLTVHDGIELFFVKIAVSIGHNLVLGCEHSTLRNTNNDTDSLLVDARG